MIATVLVLVCASPSEAMNWEGHDDWMEDMSYAQDYAHALPHAVPKRGPPCPPAVMEQSDNPYEQIPLTPDHCAPLREGPSHSR